MIIEELLTTRTTGPETDDVFHEFWVCPKCGYEEPVIHSPDEDLEEE